jgi:hypothetical protein
VGSLFQCASRPSSRIGRWSTTPASAHELRAEVHRLEAENLEFRQQAGYWKSRHREALNRITALEATRF